MKHWALAPQQTGAVLHDLAEERLLRRLRTAFGNEQPANGTPANDVLARTLMTDQRSGSIPDLPESPANLRCA